MLYIFLYIIKTYYDIFIDIIDISDYDFIKKNYKRKQRNLEKNIKK